MGELDFGRRDGALAAICLLLDRAQRRLIQLAERAELDTDDQLCALGVRRYVESMGATITKMLWPRRTRRARVRMIRREPDLTRTTFRPVGGILLSSAP